ncbi:MAG: hypothetical protein M3355_02095 [Actinomycetota bacterium]|nr:hypothetical protein [Actinomycetota bacterium]
MSHTIWRVLFFVVPLALIAGFALRPTPILGVDGESLAASTDAPVNELGAEPCTEGGGETWTCTIAADPFPDDQSEAGPTKYSVKVDGLGCWVIEDARGPAIPGEREGCVTIADHISSID